MQRLTKRAGAVAGFLLIVIALAAPPAGASGCDPCQYNNGIVCSMCTFSDYDEFGNWCRFRVIYCVDCRTGEWLYWEIQTDYCLYEPF
jgi:hypothetical protein